MMLCCFLLVLFVTTSIHAETTLRCRSNSEEHSDYLQVTETTCVIANLNDSHIDKASGKLVLPDMVEIALLDPTIAYLSAELFNISNETKILRIHNGHVPKVYLQPTLQELFVIGSHMEELLIDGEDNWVTSQLKLSSNILTHVPPNVNRLKNLTKLYLCGNLIETVQMDQFNGLDKLQTLYIVANRIGTISTTNIVRLPSLRAFNAGGNQLKKVDVRRWEMENLTKLYVRRNQLIFIVGLENRFHQLDVLELRGNNVNCKWLEDISKNRTFAGKLVVSKPCDVHSLTELCCEGDETAPDYLEYRLLIDIE